MFRKYIGIERLGSVADLIVGHPFRGAIPHEDEGDTFVLQMRDMSDDGFVDWKGTSKVCLSKGRKLPVWLRDGDIVFLARGASNKAVLLRDVPARALVSPQYYIIRVYDPRVEPEFLAWQINQQPVQSHFRSTAQGTTQASITKSELTNAPIFIPSIEEQRQVMQVVNCCEEQLRTIRAMEENQQKLMAAIANQVFNKAIG